MKTQKDIFKSALAAAEATLGEVKLIGLKAEEAAIAAFKADAANLEEDWPQWKQHFANARQQLSALATQPAASERNVVKATTPEPPNK